MEKSKRDAIVELVNKLFVYTDSQQWQRLLAGVFKEEVFFDMSSMGGGAGTTLKATEICKAWKEGFSNLDQVHHHSGNFIVDFLSEIEANVFC
ncbi:MAG: nuclear transport factor 2 family protein, partial [Bacteroidota bacterium]